MRDGVILGKMATRMGRGTSLSLEERYGCLTQHRRDHSERVALAMETLGRAHGLDMAACRLAGWGHDLAREMSRPQLLAEAARLELTWGQDEEREPILLHGPIAAQWMRLAGQGNESVWRAIRFHTTAGPHLDDVAKALFVADGVEPGRHYPERAALWELALVDLEAGYRAVLQHTLAYLQERGLAPHPHMLEALKTED